MIGGLRAVVWVDVAQALIMVIVTFIILIKSWSDAGGISVVIDYNVNASRIKVPNFAFDPYDANAFWNMLFYSFTIWATFSLNQVAMQRCLSCKDEKNGVYRVGLEKTHGNGYRYKMIQNHPKIT